MHSSYNYSGFVDLVQNRLREKRGNEDSKPGVTSADRNRAGAAIPVIGPAPLKSDQR